MRISIVCAVTMVAALGASQADAQRFGRSAPGAAGASYPMPSAGAPAMPAPQIQRPPMARPQAGQPQFQRPAMAQNGRPYTGPRPQQGNWSGSGPRPQQGNWSNHQRWGGSVGGHWQGGVNAPGGWNAYRHPSRGYHLPHYWFSPSFFIGDYAGYGLSAPPLGYGWYRYYDDAVLLDARGRVYDSVDGLNWDGGYGGGYGDDGYATGGSYAAGGGYADGYDYAQGGGLVQGAGVPQQYQPPAQYAPLPPVVQNGPVTTYATGPGYAPGGVVAGGYYYPGTTTTVVTINPAPIVTTTTTEYVETTRYVSQPRVYRAARKRYYRPARRACGCQVVQPVLGS